MTPYYIVTGFLGLMEKELILQLH